MMRFAMGAMTRLLPLVLSLTGTASALADPGPAPWKTAVRLVVQLPVGNTIGSGTVVESTAERSVILTCAHLFENMPVGAKARVDLFNGAMTSINNGPGQLHYLESHKGRMVAIDRAADLSLVEFVPGRVLDASPILPEGDGLAVGQPLTAVGCANGKDATVWSTRVLALAAPGPNPSWTECEFPPIEGRSGGGLFNSANQLVGVCDFRVKATPTGLYASPAAIRSLCLTAGVPAQYRRLLPCPPNSQCPPVPPPRQEPGFAPIPVAPCPSASRRRRRALRSASR